MRPWATLVLSLLVMNCQQGSDTSEVGGTSEQQLKSNWTRIGPGGGGSTFIPTFSYSTSDQFMLRCDMTGAYLTEDGGNSYSIITNANGSRSFGFDPANPNVIYLGSSGLNKSTDGGTTWQRILPRAQDIIRETYRGDHASYRFEVKKNSMWSPLESSQTVNNIKVDPNDTLQLYFSIDNRFFYSTDGGSSWDTIAVENHIDYIYTNNSSLASDVYLFSASEITIVNKSDWQWSILEHPSSMQSSFSFTAGVELGTGTTVFYALQNQLEDKLYGDSSPTSIWVSRDLGITWHQVTDPIITNDKVAVPTYSRIATAENDAAVVYVVTSDYQQQNLEVTHWYGCLKSTDLGQSWQWVWKGGGGSGQYSVKDGEDAQNLSDAWVQEAFGGEYIRIIDVGVYPNDGNVAILTDWYRTMKTEDGGESWVEVYSEAQPDGSYSSRGLDVTTNYGIHFDPFDKNHIAISYTDIGYHHSFNGGTSWFRSTEGIPPEWHNTCYWLVFDPEEKDKVYSVWSGLHDFPRGKMTRNPKWKQYGKGGFALSTNGGRSWTPSTNGMGFDSPSTCIVLDENSPVGNRTLYVAAFGKGVFKSIDDGQSWELKNNGIAGSLAAFELTLQPDGTLFLITSPTPQHQNDEAGRAVHMGALYVSTDGADSWERIELGDKVLFPNGLAYDPLDLDRLYLGAWGDITLSDLIGGRLARESGGNQTFDLDGGVFTSSDRGKTWHQIFDPEHYVYDVTVDSNHPGRLYCNTFDQGAYRSDDYGKTWSRLKDYNFHWGQRVMIDENDPEKVYILTYGSSVWHGKPETL